MCGCARARAEAPATAEAEGNGKRFWFNVLSGILSMVVTVNVHNVR